MLVPQRKAARILEELEQAYARRTDLWAALEEDLDRCGDYLSSLVPLRYSRAI